MTPLDRGTLRRAALVLAALVVADASHYVIVEHHKAKAHPIVAQSSVPLTSWIKLFPREW